MNSSLAILNFESTGVANLYFVSLEFKYRNNNSRCKEQNKSAKWLWQEETTNSNFCPSSSTHGCKSRPRISPINIYCRDCSLIWSANTWNFKRLTQQILITKTLKFSCRLTSCCLVTKKAGLLKEAFLLTIVLSDAGLRLRNCLQII